MAGLVVAYRKGPLESSSTSAISEAQSSAGVDADVTGNNLFLHALRIKLSSSLRAKM